MNSKSQNTNIISEKQESIDSLKAYMAANGLSVADLTEMQTNQSEITSDPTLQPKDIAGVSNEGVKDNATLTSELAALKAVVDNLSIGLSQLHEKIKAV